MSCCGRRTPQAKNLLKLQEAFFNVTPHTSEVMQAIIHNSGFISIHVEIRQDDDNQVFQ